MIEALIRDEKKLVCVVTIQPGPDKDSLNCDIFIPSKGQTLSGVMPAGGEPAQQVARAVMTVYPISALPPAECADSPLDRSSETPDEPETTKEPDRYAGSSTEEAWDEIDRRTGDLDKREKKLEQDIENFRKSHPAS